MAIGGDTGGGATESKRKRYGRLMASLKNERSSWEPHWRDLADHFLPRRGELSGSQASNQQKRGDKRNQKLIDGTPRYAARTLASGLMAGLTSPARPWFRLTTPDIGLMEYGPVKEWLYVVEQRMRDVFSRSNLYNTLPVVYSELGVFGTMAMLVDEHPVEVIRCTPFTIGTYCLANNSKLQTDTFTRELRMTVRQLVQEFGRKSVSPRVENLIRSGNYEQSIDVTHVVTPNSDRDLHGVGPSAMGFTSCYFESSEGETENRFLADSGYHEDPVMAGRWEVTSDEVYGSSPAMDALGDARALQFQQRRKAQAIDKHVDPPMVAHPSMRNDQPTALPGITVFSEQPTGYSPAYIIKPEIEALMMDIREIQERIKIAMYENLFLMISQSDRREITAREIDERHEEKLLQLGPVLERLNDEVLDKLIDRTFSIMVRRSKPYWEGRVMGAPLLPPPPPELADIDLKVEYISIMAQAQRMVATGGLERTVAFVTSVAGIEQEARDKIDFDQLIDEYAQSQGIPPTIIRDDEKVRDIRTARQEQMAAQQAAEQVPEMAKTAKMLGETPTGGETALTNIGKAIAG
jgi:CRISPR/Cas system CMR-associated protein Cmr5 small subunit